MSEEKVFVDGMIVKRGENAPDYVIANLSIKCRELLEFMKQHQAEGWVNVALKRSKGGKLYAQLDTWKPTQGEAAKAGIAQAKEAAKPDFDDDIPF